MQFWQLPLFYDEDGAFTYLEALLWAGQTVCPHCGAIGHAHKLKPNPAKRIRHGLWQCTLPGCRKQFTATLGTSFEASKLPMHVWFRATFLIMSEAAYADGNLLRRSLGLSWKTSWLLVHRIRTAIARSVPGEEPVGGELCEFFPANSPDHDVQAEIAGGEDEARRALRDSLFAKAVSRLTCPADERSFCRVVRRLAREPRLQPAHQTVSGQRRRTMRSGSDAGPQEAA